MEWMPRSIALERCERCAVVVQFVAPTKSSTNTSSRFDHVDAA